MSSVDRLANMVPARKTPGRKSGRKQKRGAALLQPLLLIGAGTTNRTRDLLITSQLLYLLSYTGKFEARIVSTNAGTDNLLR